MSLNTVSHRPNKCSINKEFDADILAAVVRTHWPVFPILIALAAGYLYLRYTKPVYSSRAIIQRRSQDEGKAFVALKIARIFALSIKKVLVLDFVLRKPKMHLGFGVQNLGGMRAIFAGRYSKRLFSDRLIQLIIAIMFSKLFILSNGPDIKRKGYKYS